MSSIIDPYLTYVSLKAQREARLREASIPTVQVHSYFGLQRIPGFEKVFSATEKAIRAKYQRSAPRPNTIPTAAENHAALIRSNWILSNMALHCVIPSTPSEIARDLIYDVDEVKSSLIAMSNKGILKEKSGSFTLSIVADHPPMGNETFKKSVVEAALKGWVQTKARSSDMEDVSYATIVENVRPQGKKSVSNILVLDLLRAPRACPDQKRVEPGQLSFLFEEIYPSPLKEACLFATLSMPQTSETIRDNMSSMPVSNLLADIWGKAKSYGLIDSRLSTTPYGERVISTLAGTPLAPFRHMDTLLQYFKEPFEFRLEKGYRSEFLKVIYSGLLYNVLAESCGLDSATQIMRNKSRVECFLSMMRTSDFYAPHKLANVLEVDETWAKNALAQGFIYGACGITTASHPHLYQPTKKADGD